MRPNKRNIPRPVSWGDLPILMDIDYVACAIFDVTTETIRNWIKSNGFPVVECGGLIRVEKTALKLWTENNTKPKKKGVPA